MLFALEPFNFAFPILGVVDDLVVLPLLLRILAAVVLRAMNLSFTTRSRDDRVVSVQ